MQLSESGIVTYGLRECQSCNGTQRVGDYIPCSSCRGTGKKDPNKPKGRNCPACNRHGGSYMKGRVYQQDMKDCQCRSTEHPGQQKENSCDTVPEEWLDQLTY